MAHDVRSRQLSDSAQSSDTPQVARPGLLRPSCRQVRAGARCPRGGPDQTTRPSRFDATRKACEALGWDYDVVGSPPRTLLANVRWLAGYRHHRHCLDDVAAALRAAFTAPAGLLDGVEEIGDPIAVLPVLFHLLWRRELHTDLDQPLHPEAVATAEAVGW
ncbi:TnsA-like heteromeric transposase endonuclease subunit [Actinosynnema sp. NPDC023587]|uniref:TnsA-like heteromeric transposase endonuclease subunit n=1 Tax=Actinosynnema sp. NPDC023587 TaxID=3154695 RepID=UPI0033C5C53D